MAIKLTVSQPAPVSLSYVEAAIKPEVTGHVTPTYEEQTVYPAAGTTFGRVEVDPIPDPTAVKEIGSNGDHDVRRYGTARVDVQPTLQSKTATPTEQAQTVLPDTGYDGLESVNIARIPTEYIIPTGTKNITQNGTESVREYDSVNVSVVPTLQDKTVTPTKQTQTVNADSGFDGLGAVQVDPIPSQYIEPTGKVTINQNATGLDISQYAEADVDVSPIGERGFYFTDFDAGRPHTLVVQGYTDGNIGFGNIFKTASNNPFNSVQTLKIKNCNGSCVFFANTPTINRIEVYGINYAFGNNQASNCANITSVICYCNVTGINADAFNTDNAIALYDFSQNTEVALLANARAVTHAEGCVIRVPQSLLTEWQAATNWNALTGVVWEGV